MEQNNTNSNRRFYRNFTDYIFIKDIPKPSDIIFIPGNPHPEMAEKAAELWKQGYAPYLLPSGKYSITEGKFTPPDILNPRYQGLFETEWEFLHHILVENGVDEQAILKEDQAAYTYENAIYSRQQLQKQKLEIKTAILCCRSTHARRCLMYYQLLFPETELLVVPVDLEGISKTSWYQTDAGIEIVLGELERCGSQFHDILTSIKPIGDSPE